jgi:hypothetical protein
LEGDVSDVNLDMSDDELDLANDTNRPSLPTKPMVPGLDPQMIEVRDAGRDEDADAK